MSKAEEYYTEDRRIADLNFLRVTHKAAHSMGVSDNVTVSVARTNGNIHPEAMREYLEEHGMYEG